MKEMDLFITRFRAKARLGGLVQSRVKSLEKMEKTGEARGHQDARVRLRRKAVLPQVRPRRQRTSRSATPPTGRSSAGSRSASGPGTGSSSSAATAGARRRCSGSSPGTSSRVAGTVDSPQSVAAGYFEQTHISTLSDSNTVLEEIVSADPEGDPKRARFIAGGMMFEDDDALKRIRVLSGGEKSRVLLGKLIATPLNLLLLDEPTNHLDIESNDALLEAIDAFDGAVVMVTHNEMFLHALADRLVVFDNDDVVVYEGGYRRFLDKVGWRDEIMQGSIAAAAPPANGAAGERPKGTPKELRRLRSEIVAERSRVLRPIEDADGRHREGRRGARRRPPPAQRRAGQGVREPPGRPGRRGLQGDAPDEEDDRRPLRGAREAHRRPRGRRRPASTPGCGSSTRPEKIDRPSLLSIIRSHACPVRPDPALPSASLLFSGLPPERGAGRPDPGRLDQHPALRRQVGRGLHGNPSRTMGSTSRAAARAPASRPARAAPARSACPRGTSRRDEKDLVEIVVARDGLAVIVHPSNPVRGAKIAEIKQIFAGGPEELEAPGRARPGRSRWSRGRRARGPAAPSRSWSWARPGSSGAPSPRTPTGRSGRSSPTIPMRSVSSPWAWSTSRSWPSSSTAPSRTTRTSRTGRYKLVRPFLFVSQGEPTGHARDFIDFVLSAEGQELVRKEGLLPIK